MENRCSGGGSSGSSSDWAGNENSGSWAGNEEVFWAGNDNSVFWARNNGSDGGNSDWARNNGGDSGWARNNGGDSDSWARNVTTTIKNTKTTTIRPSTTINRPTNINFSPTNNFNPKKTDVNRLWAEIYGGVFALRFRKPLGRHLGMPSKVTNVKFCQDSHKISLKGRYALISPR